MLVSTKSPGIYNEVQIQKIVVGYILSALDNDEIYRCGEDSRRRSRLESILKDACRKELPRLTTRTARRWFYWFVKYGVVPAEDRRIKRVQSKKGKQRYSRSQPISRGAWTHVETKALKNIIDIHPEFFLDEIQERLALMTGRKWSTKYLWERLVSDCNYSLQVATDRALQRNEEQRKEYKEAMDLWVQRADQVLFLDETHKDRNSARRRRFWSVRGQTPFRDAYFAGSHGKRYTMMGACDIHGFILEACQIIQREDGSDDQDDSHGTVDRERFILWIKEKLVPVLGRYDKFEPRSIVVLDNASIHHGDDRIKELIEGAGAKLIYTAPYSPDLNPIELMFNLYKMSLRRHMTMPWIDAHLAALSSVTPKTARRLFRKCSVPLCESLEVDYESDEEVEVAAAMSSQAIVAALVVDSIRKASSTV
jgi:hypothetical protein